MQFISVQDKAPISLDVVL